MNFYEIQFDDPLTKYSKHSPNSYTFMYTNINNIKLYYKLRDQQKQKQKQQKKDSYSISENDENCDMYEVLF